MDTELKNKGASAGSGRSEKLTKMLQEKIAVVGKDEEMAEVVSVIASSISEQYYAIYHIWADSRSVICFHEEQNGLLDGIVARSDYESAWKIYQEKYIVPEDQEFMNEFVDLDNVINQLSERNSISRNYRRIGMGWTRGTFIAGRRDSDGNVSNIIYTVADINAEIELQEKKQQAIYLAEHDSLTGTYNRKGFDNFIASGRVLSGKVGFAIIDIDNFKTLNDYFGHTTGDRVLTAVAEQLTSVFYQDDIIARIGGDEFAVLLLDCDASAWNKICIKFRTIHLNLADYFKEPLELSVTISGGITFSDSGFNHNMYQLADEGLYETKKRGRAGCTLIGEKHQVLKRWQDESLSLIAQNVLEYNNTGICQIVIPKAAGMKRRLVCSDSAKMILGISQTATPEECYKIWRDRIDPDYREALFHAEKSMLEFGQTECTFLWEHPEFGKIFLRCGGFGLETKEKDRVVLSGYCHTLKDTRIIEKRDDHSMVLNALNEAFLASYYIDLEANIASAFKLGPSNDYMSVRGRTVQELMEEFIDKIVDPRDRKLMEKFADMSTVVERFENERFLDAEYRSLVTRTWCRMRMLPVKYDEKGKLTNILLTVMALDSGRFKEVYTLDYNRRSLAALFDQLPCGIVMYEWGNNSLEAIHISEYYKEHTGHLFVKRDMKDRLYLDFNCIHPDDIESCHKAVMCALYETHELHYEYRVWSEHVNNYIWERVDAVFSPEYDGKQLIYAVYTDVTKQKEQEMYLQKSHTSLLAALDASNQLCYEYDPISHTSECLTKENSWGYPGLIENYPNSLREMDLINSADVDKFIEEVRKIENGAKHSHCDVRLKKDGEYIWCSCTFNEYYDPVKERRVSILNIVDITLRMETLKSYEDRMNSMAGIKENTLCMTTMNLTKGTYELLECKEGLKTLLDDSQSLEDFMLKPSLSIVGAESRKQYCRYFNTDYLRNQALDGNTHVELEYLLKLGDRQYEWVHSVVEMTKNPITGDVTGVTYSTSVQIQKMNEFLLQSALKQDYMFAAIIFVDTDEFYLYNPSKGVYSKCMQDYWDIALTKSREHCTEEIQFELQSTISKKYIIDYLKSHSEYRYAYDGIVDGNLQRLEISFCYADDNHTMLLAAMRNITDDALLAKYRHDSEHDLLTNLYNRTTFFRTCRELLNEYPDEKFVMLHIDIKHFRLYNTFFGDEAGDKLLCDIADYLRKCDRYYSYWAYGRIEADVFGAFIPYNGEMYRRYMVKALKKISDYREDFLIEPTIGMYFVEDKDIPIESMFTRATVAAKTVRPDTPYATATFDDAMEKTLIDDQLLLGEMQTAMEQEQFKIYLQPKYSLRTNMPVGAEALVRWEHPERGLVPPNRFVSLFESNGSIAALDRYMWEHTCGLLARWKQEGKPLMPISVNVSRISAYSKETVTFLKRLIKKYAIEPKYLELELTESAYVESPDEIRTRLAELQEYGFKILMDDFGSGYSSLNALTDLPIDILKLDMSFLSQADNTRSSKILSSMVRMSKLLNLPVIAEGVETESQASYLRSIGCEYVQGYLFARPMPVSYYEKTVLSNVENAAEDRMELLRYSPVLDIVLSNSSATQLVDDMIIMPITLFSYHNHELKCLRANKGFIDDFALEDDWRHVSSLIRTHVSEEDYDKMLRAYEKCAETREPISFRITWHSDDNKKKPYIVNSIYMGNLGDEKTYMTTFTNEEPENYFE